MFAWGPPSPISQTLPSAFHVCKLGWIGEPASGKVIFRFQIQPPKIKTSPKTWPKNDFFFFPPCNILDSKQRTVTHAAADNKTSQTHIALILFPAAVLGHFTWVFPPSHCYLFIPKCLIKWHNFRRRKNACLKKCHRVSCRNPAFSPQVL